MNHAITFSLVRKLTVQATGDLTFLAAEGKRLAYKRSDTKDEIIVIFNLESTTQSFTLPQNPTWIDLLTNKKITIHSITLKKLSAAILKKSE